MTLHSAAVYFDDLQRPSGYVLGTDSNYKVKESDTLETLASGNTQKAFIGKNHIGLVSGEFKLESSDFLSNVSGLSAFFEDIEDGSNFSDVDLLRRSSYRLLVAKRSDDAINLFSISNIGRESGQEHIAISLHQIIKRDHNTNKKNQLIWYSPCMPGYLVLGSDVPFSFDKAVDFNTKLLSQIPPNILEVVGNDYEPGPTHLYNVGFDGIRKIN